MIYSILFFYSDISRPIYRLYGLNWQCCLAGSYKMAPRILIFSIAMGAKPFFLPEIHLYLSALKSWHNNSFLCDVGIVGLNLDKSTGNAFARVQIFGTLPFATRGFWGCRLVLLSALADFEAQTSTEQTAPDSKFLTHDLFFQGFPIID